MYFVAMKCCGISIACIVNFSFLHSFCRTVMVFWNFWFAVSWLLYIILQAWGLCVLTIMHWLWFLLSMIGCATSQLYIVCLSFCDNNSVFLLFCYRMLMYFYWLTSQLHIVSIALWKCFGIFYLLCLDFCTNTTDTTNIRFQTSVLPELDLSWEMN